MPMNEQIQPNDDRLRALLREARPAPALPPRFQESVWRRIEHSQAPAARTPALWARLDRWVERLLAPRFALASLAFLLAAGGLTGVMTSAGTSKQLAQERYLSAVAPNTLR